MAKLTLRASGGLNVDIDPNNLPEGDYSDASNIVFDTGKTGGAAAIRLLESFANTGIGFAGNVKATFQNSDGVIYVLTRAASSGPTASIYKINETLTTATLILTYTHNITTDFVPDLKIIGTMLVWNYANDGLVLSFSLERTSIPYTFSSTTELTLQKKTPNSVFSVKKNLTTNLGLPILESNDFQFAARYQYDTGEFSVLSAFSQMFKAEKDTSSYTIRYDFTFAPTYATYLELYVRSGNNGSWRRVDTIKVQTTADQTWLGEVYEALDVVSSAKSFDSVPVSAKHIEVAKNRLFLANIQDDYPIVDANKKISFASSNETALTAGAYTSYVGSVTATSSETSFDGSGYVKPFANNSTIAIGVAYYDEALKTTGIVSFSKFNTGKFTYPLVPNITVTKDSGYAAPSWAKYIQFAVTKNLSKTYVYEGFASNIFFEKKEIYVSDTDGSQTTNLTYVQSVTKDDLGKITYLVVDIMGMLNAGKIYKFQDGDYISINTPNGAGYQVLDLRIVQQKDNLLYCAYAGDAMTNPDIPDISKLFFEIYTPKSSSQSEELVFNEISGLIPLVGWTGSVLTGSGTLNSTKLIGDMVFTKAEIPTYSVAPFYQTAKKTPDVSATEDQTTIVNSSFTSTLTNTFNSATTVGNPLPKDLTISWTSIGTNQDSANIVNNANVISGTGDYIRMTGFYDAADQDLGLTPNTLKIDYDIHATISATGASGFVTAAFGYKLSSRIYRVPYDMATAKYKDAVAFGEPLYILNNDSENWNAISGTTHTAVNADIVTTHIVFLNETKQNISPFDKFYAKLTLELSVNGFYASFIQAITASVTKRSGATNGAVFTFFGDRIAPIITTSYNTNAALNTTKTKILFRSTSNAITNQLWNTSAGKPILEAKGKSGGLRANTIRHSGNYVDGTKINNVNSFFVLDSNDTPIENGPIMSLQRASRLQGNGAMLLAICQRESSYIFLGEQELTQGNNAGIRALTANMIGTVRNVGNGYGVQSKESVYNYKGTIWWWDNFNKKVIKFTEQGIEVPSNTFMRSYFLAKDGVARFAYDPFYNMCHVGFYSDTYSVGYSDTLQRWVAKYSFRTGFAESFGDKMVLFRDDLVYKSLQSGYGTFFSGVSYDGSITFVANTHVPALPLNLSIWHDMNVTDYSITGGVYNVSNNVKTGLLQIDITNENNQISKLVESNFIVENNRLYAHILRDMNTTGTIVTRNLIEGNYMIGYLNKFVVTLKDKTQNMRINAIEIEFNSVSGHQ